MIKVLIVEDERIVAEMFKRALEKEGFQADIAIGGNGAINKIKEFKPDVVLLDIMMPDPNGIQVLKEMKADDETKSTMVVMLTNLSSKDDIELALSIGAEAYWVKSESEPKKIGDKITRFLEKKKKKVSQPNGKQN